MLLYFLPVRALGLDKPLRPNDQIVISCVNPLSDRVLAHFFDAPRHTRYQRWPERPENPSWSRAPVAATQGNI